MDANPAYDSLEGSVGRETCESGPGASDAVPMHANPDYFTMGGVAYAASGPVPIRANPGYYGVGVLANSEI